MSKKPEAPTADDLMTILDQVEAIEEKLAGLRTLVDRADLVALVSELELAGDRFMERRLLEAREELAAATTDVERSAILTLAAGKAVADFDAYAAGIDLQNLTLAARAERKAN